MDITTQNINKENLIAKIQTPKIFYFLSAVIVFFIIIMFLIFFDVNLTSFGKPSKSQEELIGNIFIIVFFSLLVLGLCILLLPNLKEFKDLFLQISNVTYVILYTIFAILFYSMISGDILNKYSYIINPSMLGLGAFSFYKGISDDYFEKFNINYERIKMIILLFCLITLVIVFYNINPGGAAKQYFGYSLLLTIILAIFGFLYLIVLITLPGQDAGKQTNLLSNFSSFGTYGTLAFLIFLTVVTILISSDREKFFSNKEKSGAVMILLLLICILMSIMLGANLFSDTTIGDFSSSNKIALFKKSLLVLFGLIISGLLIFWITYNIENLSGKSSIISFILNLLLVIIILGLIYKTINVNLPSGNTKKNAFFTLILNILFYIPCLVSGGFDWIGKNATGQDAGSFLMLFVAIGLIIAYFKSPSLFNYINTQGGKQLVNKPVYTDVEYNLGNYQELNESDTFDYQFGISCWVFIDSLPPNTAASYNKYTSLLNFGNKPNILYNAKTNTLMITMQQKDLKNITQNKLIDFDENGNRIIYINKNFLLQKWNNIIINYNGGTLDIFLNGELVKSSIGVVPYYTFDNLTIGENEGIKGGICNVVYFRKPLTSQNIYYLYNLVKNRTPPVLNDSNETILVKNINQSITSMEDVV